MKASRICAAMAVLSLGLTATANAADLLVDGSLTVVNNLNAQQGLQVNGVTAIDGARNVYALNGSFDGPLTANSTFNATQGMQVGGVVVVDANRNFKNIASLSAGPINTTVGYLVAGNTVIDAQTNVTALGGTFDGPLVANNILNANQGLRIGSIEVLNSLRHLHNINGISAAGTINTTGAYQMGGVTVIDASRNFAAAGGTFSGPVAITGLLSANGGIATSALTTTGNASIGGTLSAADVDSANGYKVGGLTVIDAQRNLSAVNGNLTGTLSVAGPLSASGGITTTTVTTSGNGTVGGALAVGDLVNTTNGYQVGGTNIIDASRNLTVAGGAFSDAVSIAGLVSANGGIATSTLTAIGNASIGGTLSAADVDSTGGYRVGGIAVIDAQRNLSAVNGNLTGTLTVGGLLAANGGIATTSIVASGDATIGGNLAVGNTLNVANGIQINGTTVVDSNRNLININGVSASGDIDTSGAYKVGGVTVIDALRNLTAANGDFSGAVNIGGLLAANGGITTTTLTSSGPVTIGGNLTLGGTRTLLSGFDASNQHWIVANGSAEPASRFLGFERTMAGDAGRIVANVPLSLTNGTAAAPALSFASDSTTGIFAPTAGAFGVATAGTERLRVDTSGNTMIGNIGNGNYVQVAANGVGTTLSARGSAADVSLYLAAKGGGKLIAQSVLAFDAAAQGTEGANCPQVGAITTNAAGDILTCQ